MHGVIGVVTHWSRESVWSRIREAVEIHALLPNIDRPAEYGNSMPDIVRDRLAYQNTEPPDVIVHATPTRPTRPKQRNNFAVRSIAAILRWCRTFHLSTIHKAPGVALGDATRGVSVLLDTDNSSNGDGSPFFAPSPPVVRAA